MHLPGTPLAFRPFPPLPVPPHFHSGRGLPKPPAFTLPPARSRTFRPPRLRQLATFRKRGRTWRAEVCVGDARPSGTFDTKADAVAWAAKVESELRNERRGIIVPHAVTDALKR